MLAAARTGLVEWYEAELAEPELESLVQSGPAVVITDDRPFNEYYALLSLARDPATTRRIAPGRVLRVIDSVANGTSGGW